MQNLESRISRLESKDTRLYRWVWRNVGESDSAAQARAGMMGNDNVIMFSWRDDHASH